MATAGVPASAALEEEWPPSTAPDGGVPPAPAALLDALESAPLAKGSRRTLLVAAVGIAVLLIVGGLIGFMASSGTGHAARSTQATIVLPTTTTSTTGGTSGLGSATSSPYPTTTTPPVVTTTTNPSALVTSEQSANWPNDPTRCGPAPSNQGQPFSSTHNYRVTGTIHIWSSPSVSSTPVGTIVVTLYGAGGIGCPSSSDPVVTVICKTTGDPITGPFGTDDVWEKTNWNDSTGYVTDEWLNTQWDVASFPNC